VDLAINLDTLSVIDPDRDNEDGSKPATPFGGKCSLSSILIFSNESGSLYVECESMDNKVMWVDALSSWIVSSSLSSQSSYHHSKSSKSLGKSIRKSIAGFGAAFSSKSPAPTGDSGPDVTKLDSKTKSLGIKSAAKGMMKAFSMASAFSGSNTATAGSSQKSGKSIPAATPPIDEEIPVLENTSSKGMPPIPQVASVDSNADANKDANDSGSESGTSTSAAATTVLTGVSFSDALRHYGGDGRRSSRGSDQMNTYTEGGDDTSQPTSLNAVGATAGGDVLAQLDSLMVPVSQYRVFLETAAVECSEELQESTEVMKQALGEAGAALMAASGIDMLSEELLAEQMEMERRRVRSVSVLSTLLRQEKERNAALVQRWSQARALQVELESVLQACTMQHIGTVQAMSKQFDDLQ
jgi:hypothetical protein